MQELLAILIGVGLAAACGFRVFVPLLVLAVAAKAGAVGLSTNLAWIGSTEALVALGTASMLEIVAYKVPWLDHALDTIASPAAVIAGTIVAASQAGQISFIANSPSGAMMQWGLGLIAGGVAAGAVQAATVTTRLVSTGTTGGLANPLVATAESVSAVVLSVLAVVAPVLAFAALGGLAYLMYRVIRRFRRPRARVMAAHAV
jgi:Domain of unknown function (DUF4126)